MKVLIVGGYGVFGSRLAELLVKDGHDVGVAGRNLAKAKALADTIGAHALSFDRTGDLSVLSRYEVVVDAAGPFHGGGLEPYRLARAAIEAGIHYLDLSDNGEFCVGIEHLNADAQAANVCVLSGLSSVPALSSAAVTALCDGETPQVIDAAILPGNRSPRGLSVMASILSQAGQPMSVWRGRRWITVPGWSDPAHYELPDGHKRLGWQIEVPDNTLFPEHFGANSVTFRAGLELSLMSYGLAVIALIRQFFAFPVDGFILKLTKFLADCLKPFGTAVGGMSVEVMVAQERRFWRLFATGGDGPYMPAIPIRALLRRETLPSGARVAVGVICLKEAETAMEDLHVTTERSIKPLSLPFPTVLGTAFDALPAEIRRTHETVDVSRWRGQSNITRGRGLWSRFLGLVFGFPPAGQDIHVEVTKTATRRGETWVRQFENKRFRSHLRATNAGMTERFGPFTFLLGLKVKDSALSFPVLSGRLGPVPLPRFCLPVSNAREEVREGRFHFDVELRAPFTGALLVHYQGYLEPEVGRF